MRSAGLLLVVGFVLGCVLGCVAGCGGRVAEPPRAAGLPAIGKVLPAARCAAGVTPSEPLVVDWSSAARAKLEALARRGVVAVRAQGCSLEVLGTCRAPGAYAWTTTTRKDDRVNIRDADELWANVPLGAGSLEGKLARSGELSVRMTIVGRWQAERTAIRVDELEGDCRDATHFVVAMTAGAFEFVAGEGSSVSAAVGAFGASAGGATATRTEVLARDGDAARCGGQAGTTPPEGCGALVRIELVPVGQKAAETPVCSEKTAWDGKQCAATTVATALECPAGVAIVGGRCAAEPPRTTPSAIGCPYGDPIACTRRCEVDGDGASCNDLGLMLTRGDGLAIDEPRATTYFLRACDQASAVGCNHAGMRLEYGRGAKQDEPTAAALYERACDAGWPPACNNLGRMIANGWGVPKDEPRAVDLFRKGCGQGDAGACANLGWCYVRGRGVVADLTVGAGWLRKACGAGNNWACDRLSSLR
jgi:hypothetical protein